MSKPPPGPSAGSASPTDRAELLECYGLAPPDLASLPSSLPWHHSPMAPATTSTTDAAGMADMTDMADLSGLLPNLMAFFGQ
ncbi:unnamed protein product [Protopolystoma xenopodis]|uniref:Uncharacterized protein n=1 Tax=Protopolystoma xenopodis TaxID=117903 RepID=A0A448XLA7_9PLAT|nr:unnamed protein product [Protopolystoma xenopodis]